MVSRTTTIIIAVLAIAIGTFVAQNPVLFGREFKGDVKGFDIFTEDQVLDTELALVADKIGHDFEAYRNHCLHVMTFTKYFMPNADMNIVSLALAYHDVALWTDGVLDYLDPSVVQMQTHARRKDKDGKQAWDEAAIELAGDIILYHHKWTQYTGSSNATHNAMVNAVRKADWADATMGVIKFGLPTSLLQATYAAVPEAGFHQILAGLGGRLSPDSIMGRLDILKILKW